MAKPKKGKNVKICKASKLRKAAEAELNQIEIGTEDIQNHHSETPLQSFLSKTTVLISESQPKDLTCDLSSEASKCLDTFNIINPDKISSFNAEIQSKSTDYANALNRKEESSSVKNGIEPEIISSREIGTQDRDILQNAPNIMTNEGLTASKAQTELVTCYFNSLAGDDESIYPKTSNTAQTAEDDILREEDTSKKNFEQSTSRVMDANKYFPTVNGIGVTEEFTSEGPETYEVNEETKFEDIDADKDTCSSHQIETGLRTKVSSIIQDEYSSSVSETAPKNTDYECHNPKGLVCSGTTKYIAGNSMQIDEVNNQNKILQTLPYPTSKGQVAESIVKETTTTLTESKIQVVELVTMTKKSLDLLHQRLDDMQKEIQKLTAVITSQSSTKNSMEVNIVESASNLINQSTPESTPNSTSNEDSTVVIKLTNETKTTSPTKLSGIWDVIWPFSNANSEVHTKSISGTENSSQSMLSQQVDRNSSYSIAGPPKKYKVIGRVGAKHDRPINAR